MNNEKFDEWFEETFDEAFERAASRTSHLSDDAKKESWQKVKRKMDAASRRRQRRRKYQLAGVIAASMATGAILFSPPVVTQAVSPIYQQLKEWGDGVVSTIAGKKSPATTTVPVTTPPPEGKGQEAGNLGESLESSSNANEQTLTLDQIKSRLSFKLPELKYIPQGYRYSDVHVTVPDNKSSIDSLILQYTSDEGKIMSVSMINMANGAISIASSGSASEKNLLDSGTEALYIEGRLSKLQVVKDQIWIEISGELDKKELIRIGNGLF